MIKMKRFRKFLTMEEKHQLRLDIHMDALVEEMSKWYQPRPGTHIIGTKWGYQTTPYLKDDWFVELEVLYQYEEPELRELGEIPL